jgi:hypothetical protein
MARSVLRRIFKQAVLDIGAVENGPGDKKEGKRSEVPRICSGVCVLRKRECSCA